MELIKQVTLYNTTGGSDKVYEVDLCRVESGYVVNFRYGKRGANLKEGTKTTTPVEEAKAIKAFDKLVDSKKKKGYEENSEAKVEEIKTDTKPEYESWILKNLTSGDRPNQEYKLSRIVWRAGREKLVEGLSYIIKLTKHKDVFVRYSCVYALAKINNVKAVPALEQLYYYDKEDMVRRVAQVALLHIAEDKKPYLPSLIDYTPEEFAFLKSNDVDQLSKALDDYYDNYSINNKKWIYDLFLFSFHLPYIKEVLYNKIAVYPFAPGSFRYMRYIFKASEFVSDHKLYAILGREMELSKEGYNNKGYVYVDGAYYSDRDVKEAVGREYNTKFAFSSRTKDYMKRRVAREILGYAKQGSSEYTKYATEYLLQFRQIDVQPIKKVRGGRYDYDKDEYIRYDVYKSPFPKEGLLNQILYANELRYQYSGYYDAWIYKNGIKPEDAAPAGREELNQELWNNDPQSIIKLLCEAHIEQVAEFASKVFNDHPKWKDLVDESALLAMLKSDNPSSVNIGLSVLATRVDQELDLDLIIGLMNSASEKARDMGVFLANQRKDDIVSNFGLLTRLLISKYNKTHFWALAHSSEFTTAQQEDLVSDAGGFIVNELNAEDTETVIRISEMLLKYCKLVLGGQSDKLREYLISTNTYTNMILLKHILLASTPFEESANKYLLAFLDSDNEANRMLGISLLDQYNIDKLQEKSSLVASLCISKYADARDAISPIIKKITLIDDQYGANLTASLISYLWKKEKYEGVHESIQKLLSDELSYYLKFIKHDYVFKLVESRYNVAQDLGSKLFNDHNIIETMDMIDIAKLASSEVYTMRKTCWNYFESNVDKVKYYKDEALKILDAKWEDSRKFAFDFFNKYYTENEWNSDIIINICDSVRDDVQTFGRNLAVRFFKDVDGMDYLLKLSQHPSKNLQLFVSNYIETYAAGNEEVILNLLPYFNTVLSHINKARVVKDRVFSFLKNQAMHNEKIAEAVTHILNRISLTMAIGDKAKCIEILSGIQDSYPNMPVLLKEKKIETKQF
ncbi:MAG: HEAT repeat domain-containing protein [Hyphomicrobiales bacterium]